MPLDHYPSVAQGQTTVPYLRSNLSEEGRWVAARLDRLWAEGALEESASP